MRRLTSLLSIVAVLAACTSATSSTTTTTTADVADTSPPSTVPPATTTSTEPGPLLDRIGIRTVDGKAEFYDTGSGEAFVPRGVNYVDFYPHPDYDGFYSDSVMGTNVYDPDRVRSAFTNLSDHGYNTVRIFFDTCSSEQHCIGNPDGDGLNPAYLDNMVDVMRIAGETGIRIIYTANSLPDIGGYWERFFDPAFEANHRGFDGRENADWLHKGGIDAKEAFWTDLMTGMSERDAPFEVILGWELTNEWWLWKGFAPLSLSEGEVDAGNGETYDMAVEGEKERMIVETTNHYMDRMIEVIDAHDPDGLVTMGFIAPAVEGPDWYALTEPFLETSPLDFFDFHPYYDNPITLDEFVDSYGMRGFDSKPIIMGEAGSGKAFKPSPVMAVRDGMEWYAEGCALGFDGFLNWGYYPWPEPVLGPPWTFLDSDGLMLETMAPINQPDVCSVPEDSVKPATADATVRASRSEPGLPPENVIDGTFEAWAAGDFPAQWIELELAEPSSVAAIHVSPEQWPPGIGRYRIIATIEGDADVLVYDITRFLASDTAYRVDFEPALNAVTAIRVETLSGPSWVGWREITADPPLVESSGTPCFIEAADLYSEPGSDRSIGGPGASRVLVDGQWSVDGSWYRVPGDLWVQSEPDQCEDLQTVDGDALDLVEVTFDVDVPEGSDQVFLVGAFGDDIPPYHDVGLPMNQTGPTSWSLTLLQPRGQDIAWVFTRGGFHTLERPDDCGNTDPREATVSEGLVLPATVIKWQDTDCS